MEWHDIVHLDRMHVLTGSYDNGADETTWTLPIFDSLVDTIVLGPDFGADSGTVLTPDEVLGRQVTISGDYSAGDAALGIGYDLSVELSRPYVSDREGQADISADITVREVIASLHITGAGSIRVADDVRDERSQSIEQDTLSRIGLLRAQINHYTEGTQVFLENTTPKPSTFTGVEYRADYDARE